MRSGGVTDDEEVVPLLSTPSAPHPPLRPSSTHDHPDEPMLGFVVPEREVSDADACTSLDHARASPDRAWTSTSLLLLHLAPV